MFTRSLPILAFVCAGCGSADSVDVRARCPLAGETYDAFVSANGARCGGEGFGSCFAGDRCVQDGVCELVSSTLGDAYCALLERPYDSFVGGDGARCGGEGFGACFAGDRCRSAGICEAVLSSARGQPHAVLLGQTYDAFSSAAGPRCGGEAFGACLPGDRCVEDGVCEFVLTGLGGQLREDLVGDRYDSFSAAGGPICGGELRGSCHPGDRCVSDGVCEILLSAWTP